VTEPETISFRRWESGNVIGLTKLIPNFRETFGAPYYVIHRANFHTALHRRVLDLGVKVKLAARVVKYEPQEGKVTLADGSVVLGDLIIAADGMHVSTLYMYDADVLTRSQVYCSQSSRRLRPSTLRTDRLCSIPCNS
jgi:flavin-dependent dehydrogenase